MEKPNLSAFLATVHFENIFRTNYQTPLKNVKLVDVPYLSRERKFAHKNLVLQSLVCGIECVGTYVLTYGSGSVWEEGDDQQHACHHPGAELHGAAPPPRHHNRSILLLLLRLASTLPPPETGGVNIASFGPMIYTSSYVFDIFGPKKNSTFMAQPFQWPL